jgi:CPA2 family monovalent cation:H+ antiporter-2
VHHEIALISTIAVGLLYALIGGYFANRLRLPPLVGYLVAGIALGEFSFILAELGIALRLLPPESQSLIVAGALLSITLNSFLLHSAAAIQSRHGRRH